MIDGWRGRPADYYLNVALRIEMSPPRVPVSLLEGWRYRTGTEVEAELRGLEFGARGWCEASKGVEPTWQLEMH